MKTKLSIFGGAGSVCLLYIAVIVGTGYLLVEPPNDEDMPAAWYYFWAIILIIFLTYETYRNLNIISISDRIIVSTNIIFRRITTYQSEEIKGYTLQNQISDGGVYEVIYLKQGSKKVIKISSYYCKNYPQVKSFIDQRFEYLGYEKSWL